MNKLFKFAKKADIETALYSKEKKKSIRSFINDPIE